VFGLILTLTRSTPKNDFANPVCRVPANSMVKDGFRFKLFSPSAFSRSLRTSLKSFTMGGTATQTVNTSQRLAALRALMSKSEYNVNALVIPSEDQRALSPSCDRLQMLILVTIRF
jgi:hypothetical protein